MRGFCEGKISRHLKTKRCAEPKVLYVVEAEVSRQAYQCIIRQWFTCLGITHLAETSGKLPMKRLSAEWAIGTGWAVIII